jgi:hypothetical protein
MTAFIDFSLMLILILNETFSLLLLQLKLSFKLFNLLINLIYLIFYLLFKVLLRFGLFEYLVFNGLQSLIYVLFGQANLLLDFFNADAFIVKTLFLVRNGGLLCLFELSEILVLFDFECFYFL